MPGINFKYSTFITPGIIDDQTISGLGFTPKAIIFFGNHLDMNGSMADYAIATGFVSTGIIQDQISAQGKDGTSPYQHRFISEYNVEFHIMTDNTGSSVQVGEVIDLGTDSFTIAWSVTSEHRIHYMAMGGNNLTVKQGRNTVPASTGLQSITGLGFKPDCVLFLFNGCNQGSPGATNVEYCFGAMNKNGEQGVMALVADGTDNCRSYQVNTACIARLILNSSNRSYRALFSSMDNDGFTLNWDTVSLSTTNEFYWLALSGVNIKIGTIIQPAAGNQAITGLGFTPNETIFLARGDISASSNNLKAKTMLGIGESSTSRGVIWAEDQGQ